MTMETNLAKRDWIAELWNETEGDNATRALLFGHVLEDAAQEMEDEIRAEPRRRKS